MANMIEVKVPDIGGHDNVPVIEVLVKAGDRVEKEQSLITLESDKATMEVPSSAAGVVKDVKVKVGDEVSEGAVILTLEAEASAPSPPNGNKAGGEGRGEGSPSRQPGNGAKAQADIPASPAPPPQNTTPRGEAAEAAQATSAPGRPPANEMNRLGSQRLAQRFCDQRAKFICELGCLLYLGGRDGEGQDCPS